MNTFVRSIRFFALMTVLAAAVPSTAHAYLDPGTGSYVLQIIIGVALGAAFAVKAFWLRIRTFFQGLVSKKPKGK